VFSRRVYNELSAKLEQDGMNLETVWHEKGHQHFALSWGADKLAPYWEVKRNGRAS
jgi:hypothetical protein